jgi:Arc/MetJ-type ribon-helix-helix transcriptional regulator
MGNVMIVLDDEHEALLRELAQEKYGGKKGSLSEVVKEALDKLKSDRDAIKDRLKKRLTEGIDFDYKMYQKRSEIYD